MEQKESSESKILTVEDEDLFFSLIEERLEQQGFELLDTSPHITQNWHGAEFV